jgi:hypothetical protein
LFEALQGLRSTALLLLLLLLPPPPPKSAIVLAQSWDGSNVDLHACASRLGRRIGGANLPQLRTRRSLPFRCGLQVQARAAALRKSCESHGSIRLAWGERGANGERRHAFA